MKFERLFEMRFPANANRLYLMRVLVRRVAEDLGCSSELGEKLVIAINEACINVIQHAYKGDESGEIVLEIHNNESQILFRIKDFAEPIDLDNIKPREYDDLRPGGLGVHFIREIMDECEIGHLEEGIGNYIEMKKNIS